MKLLPILILCFHCFLSVAVSVPDVGVDCDDPNIFKAVDEALRSYNNAKEDGNQFVLYRVTDAKKRDDVNGQVHYFIEYEIREGSCMVKDKHSWQDCQFQTNKPEWGKCSAHLLFNKEEKIQTVVTQNCNISKVPLEPHVTAVHHQCLGCPHLIDINSKEILHFVAIAVQNMNRQGSHQYHFDLDKIVNATRQVVSGWGYHIHYVVRKTNCSKINFNTKDSNACKLDTEGETGDCELHVSETPDGKINDILLRCTSQTGACLSCPLKVEPDDPELLNLLNQVIDIYNSRSNVIKLHKLFKVREATKYGFHQIFDVLFTMVPTNCSKPDYTILGEECEKEENAYPLSCDAKIHVTEMNITYYSIPECVRPSVAVKRISGLSPLRTINIMLDESDKNMHLFNSKIKDQQSRGKKNGHHKGQKEKKKGKMSKKPHGNDKHSHEEESSEEVVEIESKTDVEEVTAVSHTVPDLSTDQPNVPIPKDTEELVKLPANPKCPGKLWQPINLSTTIKPLTDDDLALATEDLKPRSEDEQSKPYTPKQIPVFDDKDLLI